MRRKWIAVPEVMWRNGFAKSLTGEQLKAFLGFVTLTEIKSQKFYCPECKAHTVIPAGATNLSQREIAQRVHVTRQVLRGLFKKLEDFGLLEITHPNQKPYCHCIYALTSLDTFDLGSMLKQPTSTTHRENQHTIYSTNTSTRTNTNTKVCDLNSYPFQAHDIANKWMDSLDEYKTHEDLKKKHLPTWLDALDKLNRIDKLHWDDIDILVDLILADNHPGESWTGWFNNCQSPVKLRKKNKEDFPYHMVIKRKLANKPKPKPLYKLNPFPGTEHMYEEEVSNEE